MVFRDDNPACPPEKRYKAVSQNVKKNEAGEKNYTLLCFFSPDGIHFTKGYPLTNKGHFDSLNVVFWDAELGRYRGYIRDLYPLSDTGSASAYGPDEKTDDGMRKICYMESEDFDHWSDPVPLDFGDREDYPLYTNNVMRYYRAPHMFIGFPTRYMERRAWNGSFEELGGKEKRLQRMEQSPRYGLAITDCIFMCSRDGQRFHRYDEAYLRPQMENGYNWVYGDCYPARGLFETPAADKDAPNEISFFCPPRKWTGVYTELQRFTVRLDGFVSLHAGYAEKEIVTKPFSYSGENLYINFATSARGYMTFTLCCEGKEYHSCETFGNTTDRRVAFEDGVVAALAGREVVLRVHMRDADLYAIRFGS